MATDSLGAARAAKNDEFYTQWADIEREMNAYLDYDPDVFRGKTILLPCDDPEWSNFTKFFALHFTEYGIKRLISTSYAPNANRSGAYYAPTLFETDAPQFDPARDMANGKLFVLEAKDITGDGKINIDDLQWSYLKGDGDFRSAEVTALRDEADIIITNPPFSLFREFVGWVMASGNQFSIIGNMNAITYLEVFPLIQNNRLWLGPTITSGDREFGVPDSYPLDAAGWRVDDNGKKFIRVKGVRWYTNIEHGRRHEPLQLMTMDDNMRFNKKLKGEPYQHFANYDAIEVPFTDAIPSDCDGEMGVPISFLDKYDPDQFEIIGESLQLRQSGAALDMAKVAPKGSYTPSGSRFYLLSDDGTYRMCYSRIVIRHKSPEGA